MTQTTPITLANEFDLLDGILTKHDEKVDKLFKKADKDNLEEMIAFTGEQYVDLFSALTSSLKAIEFSLNAIHNEQKAKEQELFLQSAVNMLNAHSEWINEAMEDTGMNSPEFDKLSQEYMDISGEFYLDLHQVATNIIELTYNFD
jgi:hypothetical protein|nr:MAG TPA_asm: hypothetical protein [Caudoviricetes sp.]